MNGTEHTFSVENESAGVRLDQYLASELGELSRARAQALIHSGHVMVDGQGVKPSHRVKPGEMIRISIEAPPPSTCKAEDIPLDIVFEDDHIIVVNKPAGMVVHPAAGVDSGTLVNALLAHSQHLPTLNGTDRPGIVHRLDKNTSGLLVVAKTESAHRNLSEGLSRRLIKRQYRALTYGVFVESSGTVDAPIGRSPSDRKKMAVTGIGSREAKTHFAVSERFQGISYLNVQLSTGRTHQIRVHMAYTGHPVVGDSVYGVRLDRFHEKLANEVVDAISTLNSHMLHAEVLVFDHPATGNPMRFTAPLPVEFSNMLRLLRERL